MTQQTKLRATIVLGLLFSIPAFGTFGDGGIDIGSLAIRVAIAMVVASVAVSGIALLIDSYTPKEGPPVEENATGDDVVVEDET